MINKKADYMHTLRVGYKNWVNAERFEELLKLLKKYPCNIQSLALFTANTHAPLTLEELQRRTDIMKVRMERAREFGFPCGINILATIGHHEEDLNRSLGDRYAYMTGADGRVCRGSYCMNDIRLIEEHVKPTYTILVSSNPEFIWIDDDIRYGHMPIGIGCYCDNCIELFNRQNNTAFNREELIKKLNDGCIETRRAWLKHNSSAIVNLFKAIADVVYSLNSQITLGFMTGERYNEGYDFKAFADALSLDGKHKIMWRPGGGAYSDYKFDEIVDKSECTGRQTAYLPDYVELIQYELENFPYELLKKTPVSTALEAAWAMTCGCTGTAFNMLPCETGEPISNITPFLEEIDKFKDFYILLQNKVAGKKSVGISTAWSIDAKVAVPKGDYGNYSGGMYSDFAREVFDLGLPQCYDPNIALVNIVKGGATKHWSDQKVENLLKRGVYMDAYALKELSERGFGELLGFEYEKEVPVDARECYAKHEINETIVGGIRNCRQAFHPGESASIVPCGDGAEVISNLVDYSGAPLCECALGIYKNSNGSRVSVGGYYPFSWVSDYNKTTQLKRLMVWLSNGRLPSYVESHCRIRNHTFKTKEGYVVTLLNPTNQPYKNITVAINTKTKTAKCYDMACNECEIECENRKDGGYKFFKVPKIDAFGMVVLEVC